MDNINEIENKLNTKFLGRNIICLEEVNSTQDFLKDKIRDDLPNGFVVLAENQTQGKGTNGRKWYTKPGENLTFSFLLRPNLSIRYFETLTVLIANVITCSIKELYGISLDIKSPNDIMVGNKKIGGILTESFTKGEITENIIIGIGINVNQMEFNDEITKKATSLKKEFGIEFLRSDILARFLNKFEEEYLKICKL